MIMKKCAKCKIAKPLTCFYKRTAAKDGLNFWCKDCVRTSEDKIWRANYNKLYKKTHQREIKLYNQTYMKERYQRMKTEYKIYNKQYYKKNKEEINQNSKKWYKTNKAKALNCMAKWQRENSERHCYHVAKWHKENPQRRDEYMRRSKAKRKRNLGFTTLFDNPFDESVLIDWHHINDEVVIPIPRDIHQHFNNRGTAQHRDLLEFVALQVVSLVDEDKLLTWAGG